MEIKKSNRAYLGGVLLGKALVEMVNLMYQANTARNFLSGVLTEFGKSHRYYRYFRKKEKKKLTRPLREKVLGRCRKVAGI